MTRRPAYRGFNRLVLVWVVSLPLLLWPTAGRAQDSSSTSGNSAKAPADTQGTPAESSKTASDAKPEVSSKDSTTTFKIHVNLIQVRVVVRDSAGNLVDNLHREDFQVYDQGKLQTISTFGVETAESRKKRAEEAAKTQAGEAAANGEPVADLPQRFVGVVFDDIHLKMEDIVYARVSMKKLIDSMAPTDRMGIYSTSAETTQEFTSEKDALENKMLGLAPHPLGADTNSSTSCPQVSYYMGDQYVNKSDPQVLRVVTSDTLECAFGNDPHMLSAAQSMAQAALQMALNSGDTNSEFTYRRLEDLMRRMAGLPGERILVFVSPGFILSTLNWEENGIVDKANKAGIVINTVDARGLYTPDLGVDRSQTGNPMNSGIELVYATSEQTANSDVLIDFANGTGGTFFHNSNDLATGLKLAGAAPDLLYVLGFSPQSQKMDGTFHSIKVVITGKRKFNIQARRGYFTPRKAIDPQEQAKEEIQEAIFSQDEIQDLPLELQTQYFKTGDAGAQLSVVSHIDIKGIHFRKADGRNYDNLTIDTVVFDENGNFVTGAEKLLEMRLLDATYQRLSHTGLAAKSSFDLKPGKYMVRQVVRDSEGAQMAAKNGSVVIPF